MEVRWTERQIEGERRGTSKEIGEIERRQIGGKRRKRRKRKQEEEEQGKNVRLSEG